MPAAVSRTGATQRAKTALQRRGCRARLRRGMWAAAFLEKNAGFTLQVELDNIRPEKQSQRPVDDNTDPAAPARHMHQVIAPAQPPGEKPAYRHAQHATDPVVIAQCGHAAQ